MLRVRNRNEMRLKSSEEINKIMKEQNKINEMKMKAREINRWDENSSKSKIKINKIKLKNVNKN